MERHMVNWLVTGWWWDSKIKGYPDASGPWLDIGKSYKYGKLSKNIMRQQFSRYGDVRTENGKSVDMVYKYSFKHVKTKHQAKLLKKVKVSSVLNVAAFQIIPL